MQERASVSIPSDVLDLFHDLGLTKAEVALYRYLIRVGEARCSTIARETGRSRSRIYEEMRALVEKGFAHEQAARPIRFVPAPVSEILGSARLRLRRHLAVIEREQGTLATPKSAAAAPDPPVRLRDVRVVAGRRACMTEVARLLSQSQRLFWIMGGGNFAERLGKMPRLQESLAQARRQGTDVRIMMAEPERPTPSTLWLRMSFGDAVVGLRPDPGQARVLTCINESTVLEVIVQPDDAAPNHGDDIAVRIASAVYAGAVRQRIEWTRDRLSRKGNADLASERGPTKGPLMVPSRPLRAAQSLTAVRELSVSLVEGEPVAPKRSLAPLKP